MRLNWTFIAKLIACYVVAIAVGAAIWSRSMSSIEPASVDPEFDGAVLDIADSVVRSEVLEHDRLMRTTKLASIADECDRGKSLWVERRSMSRHVGRIRTSRTDCAAGAIRTTKSGSTSRRTARGADQGASTDPPPLAA